MKIKKTVILTGLSFQIGYAIGIAEVVYLRYGKICVVTSGKDGKHKTNSLHYDGQAVDLRNKHLGTYTQVIFNELKVILEPLGYDVLNEGDHFHIEYDPKNTERFYSVVD